MAYVTKDEVKKYHGINWLSGMDTFIDSLIVAAQEYVETLTGRVFEAPSPDTAITRYYNGNGGTKLHIDDLRELTSLVVDGVTLTVNDDFYLYPLNAAEDNEPYTSIELIQPETRLLNANPRMSAHAPYIFDIAQRNVVVNGKWGYSTTPPEDVKVAVLKLIGGMIKENIGDADLKEITSETLGEFSTTYAKVKDVANFLGVHSMLQGYMRKRVTPLNGGIIKVS